MNTKLEAKSFELQKVKFNAKNGLVISWFDINKPNDLYSVDSDSQPHEDYGTKLDALKEVFAYSLGLNNGWTFARENNRHNDESLKASIRFWKDEIERITISGVSVVGVGSSKGIKISGSLKTDLGVVGLSSPIIRFESEFIDSIDETVMIGDLAETVFSAIEAEIYLFIYKGRRGGELFNSEAPVSGLNGAITLSKVG